VWIECGADEDADLDDREQWAKANASFPHWTPEASIKRLRKKLDSDGFRREALGIWPAAHWAVFDIARWVTLEDARAVEPSRVCLVVDVAPYRTGATIAVAGDHGEGRTLVMVHSAPGVGWVAGKVAELVAAKDIAEVCLTAGEARGLSGDLTRLGVEYRKLAPHDVAASCTAFQAAVTDGSVVHVGQPELDIAVANARTRRSGDAETWDRDFGVDVSALVAAAGAFHRWALQESPVPAIY
jgi:phage terminase large subunit-like protein